MPATLKVEIPELEHLTTQLRGMPAELRLEQRKAVAKALTIAQDEARRKIHSPAGHASKGIVQRVQGSGITIRGRLQPGGGGKNAVAMIFSQRSRGPGKTPPPAAGLRRWARAHGLNPWALAKSIGRKGTKGHPIMRSSFTAVRSRVIATFRDGLIAVAAKVRR